MAHDVAAHAELDEGAAGGRHHGVVQARQRAPRRRGLRHVGERAAVEQEVADVRGVELLLVVQVAGPASDAQPAVAVDDPPPSFAARARGRRRPRSRRTTGTSRRGRSRAGAAGSACSAFDLRGRASEPSFFVANEKRVSWPSETRVTDGEASPAAISCMAGQRLRPSRATGSRGSARCSGTRCTWTVASVITPSRPSLPRTISRTLGPVDVLGTGRVASTPAGVTTRTARVRSATSPYLSDCMPEERVAIQPPSVECVKLSGKCPTVQPRELSWRSSSGPRTPACTRASREAPSISSTRSMRPRSTDTIGRSLGGGRLEAARDVRPAAERDHARRRPAAQRAGRAATCASSTGRTTASGSRPSSPRRWRTRSRRLLPRAWTTRSSAAMETCSAPTAAASAARSPSGSAGAGTVRSPKAHGPPGAPRRRRGRAPRAGTARAPACPRG